MTTSTDRPNLDRLRELDKAATDAPWEVADHFGRDHQRDYVVPSGPTPTQYVCVLGGDEASGNDAALIAAYRNATPALVAALTDVLALARNMDERGKPGISDSLIDKASRRQIREDANRIRRTLSAHLDLTNGAER